MRNFPETIDLELTNKCNLKCPFCPTVNGLSTRRKGDMSQALFLKILHECMQYKPYVRLIRFGEPTLHPYWDTIIGMLVDVGCRVRMNSNGIKLDPDKVMKSGLHDLKISVHSQAGYNAVRDMLEARGGLDYPRIEMAYLQGEQDFGDVEGVDLVTRNPMYDLSEERVHPPCKELYNKLNVDWDGIVTACCSDYNREMRLGNLTRRGETLHSIWTTSIQLRGYRTLHEHGRSNEIPLCRRCSRSEHSSVKAAEGQ